VRQALAAVPSPRIRTLLVPALVAGVLSGVPSTAHALATGRPALGATRAAGTLLGRPGVARGLVAHVALTLGWTAVLVTILPQRRAMVRGAAAGLAIGALDLSIAARRYPAIAALPRLPQLADHVAFGALVAACGVPHRRFG
jgi:hypothetical protein